MGRLYAGGVLAATAGAVWMALRHPLFPSFAPPMLVLAAAWFASTSLAVVAVRRGHLALHRSLMMRSYVITWSFVVFRWVFRLPILGHLSTSERMAALGWLCWTVPLVCFEVISQGRKLVARGAE